MARGSIILSLLAALLVGRASESAGSPPGDATWESVLELRSVRSGAGNVWERWATAAADVRPLSEDERRLWASWCEEWRSTHASPGERRNRVEALFSSRAGQLEAFSLSKSEYVRLPRARGPEGQVDVGSLRALAEIQEMNTRWMWMDGRHGEAVASADRLVRCAFALLGGGGDIAGYLNSIAVCESALDAVLWLAKRNDADSVMLRLLDRSLDIRGDAARAAFRVAACLEYQLVFRVVVERLPVTRDVDELLAAVSILGQPGVDAGVLRRLFGSVEASVFDPGETLAEYGRPLARYLRSLDSDWVGGQWEKPFLRRARAWESEAPAFHSYVFRGDENDVSDEQRAAILDELARARNPIGRLLVRLLTPAFESVARAGYGFETDRRATRILLSLFRLRAERNHLPDSIRELREEGYLSTDVDGHDPFGGSWFRYDRMRGAVWSVGPDGLDDGGVGNATHRHVGKDWVWTVP